MGYKEPLLYNRVRCAIEGASLMALTVKNLRAVLETWVQSLGWEGPLEEGMATHFSIRSWRIPMDRGPCQVTVHGVTKSLTLKCE